MLPKLRQRIALLLVAGLTLLPLHGVQAALGMQVQPTGTMAAAHSVDGDMTGTNAMQGCPMHKMHAGHAVSGHCNGSCGLCGVCTAATLPTPPRLHSQLFVRGPLLPVANGQRPTLSLSGLYRPPRA